MNSFLPFSSLIQRIILMVFLVTGQGWLSNHCQGNGLLPAIVHTVDSYAVPSSTKPEGPWLGTYVITQENSGIHLYCPYDPLGNPLDISPPFSGPDTVRIGSVSADSKTPNMVVTTEGYLNFNENTLIVKSYVQAFGSDCMPLSDALELRVGTNTDDFDEARPQAVPKADGGWMIGLTACPQSPDLGMCDLPNIYTYDLQIDPAPLLGAPIGQLDANEPRPSDIASFGGGDNRYLFVYTYHEDNQASIVTKPVNANGMPAGPAHILETTQDTPLQYDVEYDPIGKQFIISWTSSGLGGQDAFVQVLDVNGKSKFGKQRSGTTTTINASFDTESIPGSSYFLSTYTVISDAYVRLHRPDGVVVSNPVLINSPSASGFHFRPRISIDSNAEHLFIPYIHRDFAAGTSIGRGRVLHLTQSTQNTLGAGNGDDVLLGNVDPNLLSPTASDQPALLYSQNFGVLDQTLEQIGITVSGPGLIEAQLVLDPQRDPNDPNNSVLSVIFNESETLIVTESIPLRDLLLSNAQQDKPLEDQTSDILMSLSAYRRWNRLAVEQNSRLNVMAVLDDGDNILEPDQDLIKSISVSAGDAEPNEWDILLGDQGRDFFFSGLELSDPNRPNVMAAIRLTGALTIDNLEFYLDNLVITVRSAVE